MADEISDEEETFPADEMDRFIGEILEEVLKDCNWYEEKVPHQINTICELLNKQLIALQKPYKWMVTCVMQQKISSTINCSMSCHYANPADSFHTFMFPPIARSKDAASKNL